MILNYDYTIKSTDKVAQEITIVKLITWSIRVQPLTKISNTNGDGKSNDFYQVNV